MKLNTMHLVGTMSNGHDGAIVLCSRRDLEICGHVIGPDHKRVIAPRLKGLVDSLEHALAVVHDGRGLSMHRDVGATDDAAVHEADCLGTGTHTHDRPRGP